MIFHKIFYCHDYRSLLVALHLIPLEFLRLEIKQTFEGFLFNHFFFTQAEIKLNGRENSNTQRFQDWN